MLRVGTWGAAIAVVILGISGCSGVDASTPETLPTLTPRPPGGAETPTPLIQMSLAAPTSQATGQIPALAGDAAVYVQGAVNVLAATLNVPAPSIAFLNIIEAEWPDSSLGCPQPGQAYVPAITPGYVITLKAGDTDYEVHSDKAQHYVVCQVPGAGGATPTPPDPVVAEFIQQARVNLATQLSISPDTVAVVSSEAMDWTDGNLGCAPDRAGLTPQPGPISGYKIVLAVGDEYYEYHTSFDKIQFCEEPIE